MLSLFVLVGSLRQGSMNKKLAHAMEKLATDLFSFTYGNLAAIPLYNQDIESPLPDGVALMKEQIKHADAVLLVTPEYNRSVPGVLKNAIDWCSRPYGNNAWAGKPCGMVGVSVGAAGTCAAQAHLRSVMVMLGAAVVAQPEVYLSYGVQTDLLTKEETIGREDTRQFLRGYLETLAKWTEKVK